MMAGPRFVAVPGGASGKSAFPVGHVAKTNGTMDEFDGWLNSL